MTIRIAAVAGWFALTMAAPVFALTGGPTQPEYKSFSPIGDPEIVDLFTGDLRYAIPVIEVPGPAGSYPIQLTYASGISLDQEASWVGLGWTLSPGAIVRQVRGLPDDFDGTHDNVESSHDMQPSFTWGFGIKPNLEAFGADPLAMTRLADIRGYYNNKRGVGFLHSIGLSGQASAEGISAGIGLDLTIDSFDGVRAAPSLALGVYGANCAVEAQYHSIHGVTQLRGGVGADGIVPKLDMLRFGGFARPMPPPTIGLSMTGTSLEVGFKGGAEVQGVFPNLNPYGFFTREELANKEVTSPAYGYLYLDKALDEWMDSEDRPEWRPLLDFSREKDGSIHDESPNLALPVVTHDLFLASGNDLTGTFRAYRNDVPVVFDHKAVSSLAGGTVAVEVGAGTIVHLGVAGSGEGTQTRVKPWDGGDGAILERLEQAGGPTGPLAEKTYFKFIGEPSQSVPAAALPGGGCAVAPNIRPSDLGDLFQNIAELKFEFFRASGQLHDNSEGSHEVALRLPDRVVRASVIQSFTIGDLKRGGRALRDFSSFPSTDALPDGHKDNHIGGFRVTLPDGKRYVYAIPVYNLVHEEHEFSVDPCGAADPDAAFIPCSNRSLVQLTPNGNDSYSHDAGDQYLLVKRLNPHVTSYLLTTVIGPDYIDVDSIPGPSSGDAGYWVKFNYERDGHFAWRDPFIGARYVPGPENGPNLPGKTWTKPADRGYFTYGVREQWYLRSIETQTHVAVFETSSRDDGAAANHRVQNQIPQGVGALPKKLDAIRLFTREQFAASGPPLLVAHFEYDYHLQPGTPNRRWDSPPSAAPCDADPPSETGKLTLTRLWFEHDVDMSGQLSPYAFSYGTDQPGASGVMNPPFSWDGSDRWQSWRRPASTPECGALREPYTQQVAAPGAATDPDADAAAWNLTKIEEPTGRTVTVGYESDDYAFVQDRPAMRMFPLRSVSSLLGTPGDPGAISRSSHDVGGEPRHRCVCVPVDQQNLTPQLARQLLLGGDKEIFFKIRIDLKGDGSWQEISGYAEVSDSEDFISTVAADGTPLVCIPLKLIVYPSGGAGYHPFSAAAWQYLRLQQPELIHESVIDDDPSADDATRAARALFPPAALVDAVIDLMRGGAHVRWFSDGWGQRVDLDRSWIRLREPDGIKRGGGSRVRQVRIDDAWEISTGGAEPGASYGSIYEYRLPDGRSSGVASYEPMEGGDENAVRQPKPFEQKVLLAAHDNLYFEKPLGESYYPAPVVGYSVVTQRSLPSQNARQAVQANPWMRPTTAGPVVHEFYTAREFPVRSDETNVEKHTNPTALIPIPFLGAISLNSLAAAQGYSILTNDMHGKPKKVTEYEYARELDDDTGDFRLRAAPVCSTSYEYRDLGSLRCGDSDPEMRVLTADGADTIAVLGADAEMVADVRMSQTTSFQLGIDPNTDVLQGGPAPAVPIPVPMPTFSFSLTEAKTIVVAKVVHRSAILDRVVTTTGAARSVNSIHARDPISGRPLLTSTTNEFGDPVFEYMQPARWRHAGMSAGYAAVGLQIGASSAVVSGLNVTIPGPELPACEDGQASGPPCVPIGSEFVVDGSGASPHFTLIGTNSDGGFEFVADETPPTSLSGRNLVLVRSGARNVLGVDSGKIRALRDPTQDRGVRDCDQIREFPCPKPSDNRPDPRPACELLEVLAQDFDLKFSSRCDCAPDRTLDKYLRTAKSGGVLVLFSSGSKQMCRIMGVDDSGRIVDLTRAHVSCVSSPTPRPPAKRGALSYSGLTLRVGRSVGRSRLVHIYSDCKGFQRIERASAEQIETCREVVGTVQLETIPEALDATWSEFDDSWFTLTQDVRFAGTAEQIVRAHAAYDGRDDFAKGVRGIWRPRSEWVYVDDRKQSTPVDIRKDGTMDVVPFPESPKVVNGCDTRWRMKRFVNRVHPQGPEIDEANPLGIRSAILLGHEGTLPLAVAANADNDEIGFEGFEAYAAGVPVHAVQTGETNIDFTTRSESYEIRSPELIRDFEIRVRIHEGILEFLEDEPLVKFPVGPGPSRTELPPDVGAALSGYEGYRIVSIRIPGLSCDLAPEDVATGPSGVRYLLVGKPAIDCFTKDKTSRRFAGGPGSGVPSWMRYEGSISVRIAVPIGQRRTRHVVTIADSRAHTGRRSLKVSKPSEFDQVHFVPHPGRRYVVSGWVSRTSTDVPTYRSATGAAPCGLRVRAFDGFSEVTAATTIVIEPDGPIIDGWQRIEGAFLVPDGGRRLSLELLPGSGTAYFDDIRLHPEESKLETHVFDLRERQLSATLDENNYATLFDYHPDGTLRLIRRETVRGILTVSENRTHLREREP